jgi:hypothetical protein
MNMELKLERMKVKESENIKILLLEKLIQLLQREGYNLYS